MTFFLWKNSLVQLTNKETTSPIDSQNPRSLTKFEEESYNIFPYYCNIGFVANYISNIIGNNEENQPSLNGTTNLTSLINSTSILMAPSTITLDNSIPTIDECLARAFSFI